MRGKLKEPLKRASLVVAAFSASLADGYSPSWQSAIADLAVVVTRRAPTYLNLSVCARAKRLVRERCSPKFAAVLLLPHSFP